LAKPAGKLGEVALRGKLCKAGKQRCLNRLEEEQWDSRKYYGVTKSCNYFGGL
jgi:hypothetical protein